MREQVLLGERPRRIATEDASLIDNSVCVSALMCVIFIYHHLVLCLSYHAKKGNMYQVLTKCMKVN
jgi:hypothetical protein